jgi:hypothetical protein
MVSLTLPAFTVRVSRPFARSLGGGLPVEGAEGFWLDGTALCPSSVTGVVTETGCEPGVEHAVRTNPASSATPGRQAR